RTRSAPAVGALSGRSARPARFHAPSACAGAFVVSRVLWETAGTFPQRSPMANPEKSAAVAEITAEFRDSTAAVLTEYRGLTVAQMTELRRSLGEGAKYAVVKNTLTKIAAERAGVTGIDDLLVGPTGVAFVTGDPVEAAKTLREFARTNQALVVKGGFVEGKPMSADDIRKLAD